GEPSSAWAADEPGGKCGAGVGLLDGEFGENFADGPGDVRVVFDLDGGVGDAVEIAGVVGASGTEFPADWPAGEIGEEPRGFAFGGVALAFGRTGHDSSSPGWQVLTSPRCRASRRQRLRMRRSRLLNPPQMPM